MAVAVVEVYRDIVVQLSWEDMMGVLVNLGEDAHRVDNLQLVF